MSRDAPIDADRYPMLQEPGREMLRYLREHPHAPQYRNHSGNRLTDQDLQRVLAFEQEVASARVDNTPGVAPAWLPELVARCYAEMPFYQRLGSAPERLADVPPVGRAELGRDIAAFVPDSAPLDRLINFRTSGTTGHPLLLPSHPVVAANYLAFHKRALRRFGIELRHGRGQVGVVLLGHQRACFTYVSVTPSMDESGLAKINLHPGDWRRPEDRGRYLSDLQPEVLWGDPISYAELLTLELDCRPRALLSTAMALGPGLRQALEQRFGCPVLDVYSMNEAGPIAVFDPTLGAHALLQHCMYVEILAPNGSPVAPGQRGEITLTGGFNFCLPLLRYRTGDYAVLGQQGGEPVLRQLAGRPPVRFRTAAGEWLNNIEVTHALGRCAIAQFTLHQTHDAALCFRYAGGLVREVEVRERLDELFEGLPLRVERLSDDTDKLIQYTSDLPGALIGS